MSSLELVREIEGLKTDELCAYLNTCDVPFQPSQLYSAAEEAKFVDTSLRSSEFRALTDEKLFRIAESLVARVSEQDPGNDYTLVRNDVTHIRYRPGGFFSRHQDFLSMASNMVEEYTLLVCITPPHLAAADQGGATVVHIGGQATAYRATTTPGSALLFRKDVEHEGAKVTAGEKHIVSLNLWAVRKRSEQVLLVSFAAAEGEPAAAAEGEAAAAAAASSVGAIDGGAAALLAEANARNYAIAASDLAPGTMLALQVEWANNAADAMGGRRPTIVRYEAPCDYAAFDVIFRICVGMHLAPEELVEHAHVLDFFFPSFDTRRVLVDFAVAPTDERPTEQSAALAAAAKTAAEQSARAAAAAEVDAEVICCESDERTAVVAELARTLDLPYAPFRMIFVEGIVIFNFGGDMSKGKVPVLPAWVSLGDYDNVLLYRKLSHKGDTLPCPLGELHALCDLWTAAPELAELAASQPAHAVGKFLKGTHELGDHAHPEYGLQMTNHARLPELGARWQNENGGSKLAASVGLGLRVALPPGERRQLINKLLFEDRFHIADCDLAYLPEGIGCGPNPPPPAAVREADAPPPKPPCLEASDEAAAGSEGAAAPPAKRRQSSAPPPARLFHRDVHGRACFTADEARQATERVLALELDERVKACLQRKAFVLPQHAHSFNSSFCNESVYGTMNLLSVSGLVRLEAAPAAAPAQPAAPFDAWPPPEVLNDKRHRDYETRPRRWEDDGDETDPSNAPSEGEGDDGDDAGAPSEGEGDDGDDSGAPSEGEGEEPE